MGTDEFKCPRCGSPDYIHQEVIGVPNKDEVVRSSCGNCGWCDESFSHPPPVEFTSEGAPGETYNCADCGVPLVGKENVILEYPDQPLYCYTHWRARHEEVTDELR
jgi:hypothetical protein